MEDKKLVIIDGNSLVYRAFYALPILTNLKGEYSNAIYGFAMELVKVINELKPTHMAVCFDVSKHTFRNDLFGEYKATRKPMPEELLLQLEPIKKMLRLMNIKMFEKENFEADDLIGTIAKKSMMNALILTGDRDSFQLIDDKISVCFMKKGLSEYTILTPENIKSEYGVNANQVIDLKALQGDSADNIPGVAGIGPKTAVELIENFGSLDGVYGHIAELSQRVSNKLNENRVMAYLSKELATIKTDVDIDFNEDDCELSFPFTKKLMSFFEYYNIRSLSKKTGLYTDDELASNEVEIKRIGSISELAEYLKLNSHAKAIAFFVNNKTIYSSFGDCEIVCDVASDACDGEWCFSGVLKEFNPFFENNQCQKIFCDAKEMFYLLVNNGIAIPNNFFDVSVALNVCEGVAIKTHDDVFEVLGNDKAVPAVSLFKDKQTLEAQINELNIKDLVYNVEFELVKTLFAMERRGFKVDIDAITNLERIYKEKVDRITQQIYELVGHPFNINSPKQLAVVLFDELHLPNMHKSSTSADVLESLLGMSDVIPLLIEYRKASKFYGTYITAMLDHIDDDGKIRTNFNQSLTTTGRLSSNEPNLQNIPIRSEDGREIRSMFVADYPNRVLIDADYSQIELRVLAHLSDDEFFINAFNNNEDIHNKTAQEVFGVGAGDVTDIMRRVAKVVNFGIVYGISEYGLSSDLKISSKEAKKYIEDFFKLHRNVDLFMKEQIAFAKENGYAKTMFGRIRRIPEINAKNFMVRSHGERVAQNMSIQGTAAEIIKKAMINVERKLIDRGLDAKLIMQVHDELVIECSREVEVAVKEIVKREMENVVALKVPLIASVNSGYRWGDIH